MLTIAHNFAAICLSSAPKGPWTDCSVIKNAAGRPECARAAREEAIKGRPQRRIRPIRQRRRCPGAAKARGGTQTRRHIARARGCIEPPSSPMHDAGAPEPAPAGGIRERASGSRGSTTRRGTERKDAPSGWRGSSRRHSRPDGGDGVSLLIAYALWLVGGWWGLHHFYLGREHQVRPRRELVRAWETQLCRQRRRGCVRPPAR